MFKLGLLFTRFRKELLLMWHLLHDGRTPIVAKLVAIAAALYIVSPFDLITDFLPILGWLDDGIIALLLFKLAQRLLPDQLLAVLKAKLDAKSQAHSPRS
ncbi:MAG: DUF1232 domain-containing protein [Brachymonas sp.]|nr:DUF1232 domain-containing protein [Brachymonas sp.]